MKTIEYKGRIVFQKINIPDFKRMTPAYLDSEGCFIFVASGHFKVRGQTAIAKLNRNHAVLTKCTSYFYENDNTNITDDVDEAIGVLLHPEVFQTLFNDKVIDSSFSIRNDVNQVKVDELLENFRNSINMLLDCPNLADELLIESKLREFVLLMTKKTSAPSEIDFLSAIFKPYKTRFENIINNNLYSDLQMKEWASLCHMSQSTFKRQFKVIYGEPPMKYITRLKIAKAKQLLINTNMCISNIMQETGFESVSTFNRVFKAHIGLSPSSYKNQNN